MSKLRMLTGLLAAAFAGPSLAATVPTSPEGFYVVVPLGPERATIAAAAIEVSLAPSALPSGLVGIPYDGFDFKPLLRVTGDDGYTGYGVKWTVIAGTLPAGLTLNDDGTLSGTPTSNGTSTFQVQASYKTKNGVNEYQVLVGQIAVEIAAGNPPEAIAGQFYNYDLKPLLTVSGDPAYAGAGAGITWSVVSSSLPDGLALRTDGTISGTPTVGGTGTVTARATYRGTSGEQTYELLTLAINVKLASANPPQAIVGQAYSYDLKSLLTVTGDAAYNGSAVTWTTLSDNLPAGITLRPDGTIAGMPTTAGSGFLTVRASYRGVNDEQAYEVVTLAINVALGTATPPQAIVGQAYSFDLKKILTVTGDNAYNGSGVTWSVVSDTLPSGLYLTNDGTIGGAPTKAGGGAVTARATYRGVNGQQTYQVVTLDINVALAAGTPPQAIVGQAYSYDLKSLLTVTGDSGYDGSGVTWSVVSSSLPEGLSLRANGTVAGTPTKLGSGGVTARATYRGVNGEQTYQVVTLDIKVALATGAPPQAIVGQAYAFNLKPLLTVTGDNAYTGSGVTWTTVSSTLPAGLALAADGTITGTPTASGTGALVARATYRNENGEQTYQVVALNIVVTLAAGSPPQAIVGQAYNYDLKPLLSVTGDSAYNGSGVTWTVVSSSLANGLYLRNDGTIVGTPTASGTGTLIARATYRDVNGQQSYQVVTLGITVSLATAAPPQAIVGQAYTYDLKPFLTVSGDSAYDGSGVTWTVVSNTLPAGLTLRSDGTIVGTPTAGGTGSVTARATYRGVNGDQAYQVVSLNITVALATATPPQAIVGQAYTYDLKQQLTVTGDNAYNGSGVTWSVVSSSLPAGLQLLTNGTISGTPTASGTGTITARATYRNVNGQQTYQIVTLNIVVTLAAGTAPQAIVGQAYSYDLKPMLTVSGDSAYTGAGVTWSTVSSSLPAGLALRADGVVVGTPTAAGSGTITARATYRNVNGQQTYQIVTLGITVALAAAAPPQAIVGQAYSYDLKPMLTVSGDSAYNGSGVTWTVVSSTLPAGLTLRSDGTIAGTPTASGTGTITARATYRNVNGDQTYQVVSLNITVALAAATPPQAIVGQAYSYDLKPLLTVSGDNGYNGSGVTWTVVSSTLPAGLTLRSDGTVAGTPTASGTGTVTARATYRNVNGQQTYQIVTLNIVVTLAAGNAPQAIVGQAYSYDLKPMLTVSGDSAYTGTGVTWSTVSSSLPAGLALRADGVIVGTPAASGSGTITARATYRGSNGQQTYQIVTLNITVALAAGTAPQAIVGQAYSYDLKPMLTVSGDSAYNGSGVTWTVVSSTLPAGLTLRSDGTIAGTPTAAGTGTITARATYRNVNGDQTYQVVSLNITVALAAATPPQAIVGQAYSYDLKPLLSVSGDTGYNGSGVTWTVVSSTLPAGLTLRSDGTVAGTPTASGTGAVTARATYRGNNGQQTYQVVSLGITVTLATASPPQAIVGQAYSYNLKPLLTVAGDSAYNGSGVTWTAVANTLPAGLALASDGTITGTPSAAGTGTITARATYRGVNGDQVYQVVTLNIVVSVAAGSPPQAIVGQAYSYDIKPLLSVTGDSAYNGSGVTWTVVSTALPAGLQLLSDGTIGGTPTAAGTGSVTARATYRGNNGQQTFQVVTLSISVSLAAATPPQGIVGQAYSYALKPLLTVSGDSAYNGSGVTWSLVSGTLPAGLTLLSDGTISGTPTAGASSTITARATYRGNNGQQTYQFVTLNIAVTLAAATLPQAIVGQVYSYDVKPLLSVSGDSAYNGSGVTWSTVSGALPAGLTLRSDGTIGGTPTASGTGSLVVRATYRGVNGQQTYQVVSLNITVALATASPPQAIVGQAYSYDMKPLLTVSGDSAYTGAGVTWTVVSSTLPAGLSMRSDGTIAGTPTAAGTGSVTARATYRGVNGQQTYQVVTLGITVTLATGSPPQAIVGQAYSYDLKPLLTVSGDSAYNGSGVTWSLVSSTLPAGLQLASDGTINGTPTAGGTGSVTARATYRGVNGQQTYQVVTLNIVVSLAAATPPQARVGESYSYDLKPYLSVSGDSGYTGAGVTWSVVANSLPSGLVLTTAGTVSGTPSAATTGALTARATYRNVNGQQTYSITALPAYTYAWQAATWSTPSACGATTSTRSVTCLRSDGSTVADAYCTAAKPATTQAATDYSSCTYTWQTTGWSTTSACGATTASRTVYCQRSDGTTVADASCTGTKPAATTATTDYSSCTYSWSTSNWSTPAACGSTTATRSVSCVRSDGTTVADASCTTAKPATTQATTNYSTCTYSWSSGTWSTPAACGATTSTRTVSCVRSDGTTVADSSCTTTKPATTQAATDYSSCSYSWNYSTWSTPSGCGSVTQTRSVWCQRSDGTTVADASCTGTKPASSGSTTNYSSCTYSNSYGQYGACSVSCGGGTQTRSVTCLRSDGTAVSSTYCPAATTTQACNTQACYTYSWSTGNWSTPNGCGAVTATRSVSCVRSDGTGVSDSYCSGTKPATTQAATSYSSCTYTFSYGNYGACSVSCGGGTQTRSASCVRSDGTVVANSYCGTPTTSRACNTQACAVACPATQTYCEWVANPYWQGDPNDREAGSYQWATYSYSGSNCIQDVSYGGSCP